MATADLTITIQGRDQASRILRDVQNNANGLGRSLGSVGTIAAGVFGGNLLMAGARQATGAIRGTIAAGIDFESAFAGVRKTVDASEAEFAALSAGIRDMSKQLPSSAVEIAGVAEAAGQLGIATEDILSFTRVMVDLGETTNLTSEEAATSLARFANVMGTSAEDFDRLGSAIVDLGNNSATTEAEIVEFAQRVAGAGKIAGLTEAEVLGIGAAFSSAGIEAEAGGTAVQKVLLGMTQAVAQGGDELTTFANIAGFTAAEFQAAWEQDAAAAFTNFVEGLSIAGDDAFAVLEALGLQDQRLIRSFLSVANAGDLLTESINTGTTAWEENTALANEAEQRYKTTAAQLEIAKNNVTDFAISLSSELLPAIVAISKEMVEQLPSAIAIFEGIGVAANESVIPALRWVMDNEAAMIASIVAIGAAFAFMFPGGALVIGLGAVVTSIGLVMAKNEELSVSVLDMKQKFLDAIADIIDGFADVIEAAAQTVAKLATFGLIGLVPGGNDLGANAAADVRRSADFYRGEASNAELEAYTQRRAAEVKASIDAQANFASSFVDGLNNLLRLPGQLTTTSGSLSDEERAAAAAGLAAANDEAAEAVKSFADALAEAESILFGGPTREEAALGLELSKFDLADARKALREAQKEAGVFTGAEAPVFRGPGPDEEQRRNVIQAQLDLMQAENTVQQQRIILADQSLLLEGQQNAMTEILIGQTERLSGQFSKVADFFATLRGEEPTAPGYALGTPFVPDDGMYMLHRGERVTTAADNRNYDNSRKSVRINSVNIYQGTSRGRDLMNDLSLARIAG